MVLSLPELEHGSLPLSQELSGAILFLDVCGFTKITEFAHAKGRYGVEIITGVLNNYFEQLSQLIYPEGGEILKYGGDSCLAVFPDFYDQTRIRALGARIETMIAALDAAYQEKFGFGFAVHGGFTLGSFKLHIVGSRNYHLDYFPSSIELSRLYQEMDAKRSKGLLYNFPQSEPITRHASRLSNLKCREEEFLPASVSQKLSDEDSPAELRNAAVIFVHLSAAAGDEIPLADYQHFFIRVQRLVYDFGGVLNKIDFTEKGYLLLILFGVPEVHTDDIERAFLCALRIIQIPASQVQCRIGITYSNIFFGIIGSTLRYEYGIIGNAVNIAARLMSYAHPGQIALSKEIIPAIASRFETTYVKSTTVKGIQEPIDIYLLEGERPEHWDAYREQFSALPNLIPAADDALIRIFLNSEQASALGIIGAQGTGKSFLIWQIYNRSREPGKAEIIVVGRRAKAFRLEFFFNLLRRKLGISSFSNEFYTINEYAHIHHLDWNQALIERYIFGEQSSKTAETAIPLGTNEAELAISLLTGLCFEIFADCRLLLLDNLDYYDAESLLIVNRLITMFLAAGRKVVFTCQKETLISIPEGFSFTAVKLNLFSMAQSVAIIGQILPMVTSVAKHRLHTISEGNPQFLIALLYQIRSYFNCADDLIGEDTLQELQSRGLIPQSMENLLMAQFQGLPAPFRQLLKCAAIYGKHFSISELDSIFSFAPDEDIPEICEELSQQKVLESRKEASASVYNFANPLLLDSIYRSVLWGEKRSLHLQIAQAHVSQTDAHGELLQSIVHHYLQADDLPGILHWSELAAAKFFASGAWVSSRYYYQILVQRTPDKDTRTLAQLKLIELCLIQADNAEAKKLLDSLPLLSGKPAEIAIYLNATYLNNIADYLGLQSYLQGVLPKLKDENLKPMIYIYYLEAQLFTMQLKEFFKAAKAEYPKLHKNPAAQNRLAGVIAQACMNQGDYLLAERYYQEKLKLSSMLNDGLGIRIASNGMGGALSRLGKKQEALEKYTQALEIAERIGDRNGYSKVLLNLGVYYRNEMAYDKALECYQKSLLLAARIGNIMQESIILYDMGELLVYQDKLEAALPLFQKSLEMATRINDYSGISFCNDAIGDVHFKRDEYSQAETTYLSNLALQQQIHDQEGIAHTWGNLGNCAKVRKDYPAARRYYYMQLTLLTKVQDWDGAGRARFNLAMINREQGYFKRAMHQLQIAKNLFNRCDAKHYLQICAEQELELLKLI
ncbi:MAG: tetratricopeptide repeat protein [Candidatus Cloacimonas sp.]|nr:tetratricopeptide repeat protein [Candidatus Cloacimonas sp.]